MSLKKLYNFSLIGISGSDAQRFLQGQLSCDVSEIGEHWQYAGLCNVQGRVISLLTLWRHDGGFFALLPEELVDVTIKRLQMYVLRSDVQIELKTGAGFYWSDSFPRHLLNDTPLSRDVHPRQVYLTSNHSILTHKQRHLIVEHLHSIESIDATDDTGEWLCAEIHDGLPQIHLATSEKFLPQMMNLDKLDGISFSKGCYTGQEVIARTHHLGKLKQRMVAYRWRTEPTSLTIGDRLFQHKDCSQPVATVVRFHQNCDQLLAVVRLGLETQSLYTDLYTVNEGELEALQGN